MIPVQGFRACVLLVVVSLGAAATQTTVDQVEGNLRVEASIPRVAYASGELVDVTLTVHNRGERPITITFASGQRYDLLIRRPRGDEVWRWSHDKAFTQIVQTLALRAGEAVSFKEAWDQRDLQGRRVDPGTYEAVAIFLGRREGLERRRMQLPSIRFVIRQ